MVALPAMTMANPMSQVATDSSPEEVERYGARGYAYPSSDAASTGRLSNR